MRLCRKAFLLTVGTVMISFAEVTKAILEAQRSIEKQGKKPTRLLKTRYPKASLK